MQNFLMHDFRIEEVKQVMKSKKSKLLTLMALLTVSLFHQSSNVDAAVKEPVRIISENLVVVPTEPNTIQVMNIIQFINEGDTAENQLSIYLPEGYSNLTLHDGLSEENMEVTDKGIIDLTGIAPGEEKQVLLTYQLPMENNVLNFTVEQAYVTENIYVIIQPGILSFNANDLVTQSDLFEMEGKEYRRFTRLNLHPGEPWPLRFEMIADSSTEEREEENTVPIAGKSTGQEKVTEDGFQIIGREGIGYGKAAITILIIIVAFSAALIGLKRDMQRTIGQKSAKNTAWLMTEKESLLKERLQLEEDYRNQLIGPQTYETTKGKLRDRLIQLTSEFQKRSVG